MDGQVRGSAVPAELPNHRVNEHHEKPRIRLFDTLALNRLYAPEVDAVVRGVIERGDFEGGEDVRNLEREFAAYCGARYCAVTTSGTMAMHFAVRALGLGEGDEVLTAANTDIGTCLGIEHAGATVGLVDIDAGTFNMDPAEIEARITPRTRAIAPVHMYGIPADMAPILAIAKKRDLLVIEDAALAHGATYDGKKAGALGDAGIFSFAAGKVLGGIGFGGAIVTEREDVVKRIGALRFYGRDDSPYRADRVPGQMPSTTNHYGFNARLDTIQAAVLRVRLRHLHDEIARRRAVADIYTRRFAGTAVRPPAIPDRMQPVWRNYAVLVPEARRDEFRRGLLEHGVETGVLYVPPIHLQPYWKSKGYREGQFPTSERVADQLICLPSHALVRDEDAHEIADHLLALV
ncbi:MAG: DegT/DnrJ/EryC1/StrS family aminotransferase [Armatimonadetes bacterium]|nr:DegT/DnrJ/EryC1/StrS family aminotransferase [Armatimonadota bacterium]